jgi:hypothetical protein
MVVRRRSSADPEEGEVASSAVSVSSEARSGAIRGRSRCCGPRRASADGRRSRWPSRRAVRAAPRGHAAPPARASIGCGWESVFAVRPGSSLPCPRFAVDAAEKMDEISKKQRVKCEVSKAGRSDAGVRGCPRRAHRCAAAHRSGGGGGGRPAKRPGAHRAPQRRKPSRRLQSRGGNKGRRRRPMGSRATKPPSWYGLWRPNSILFFFCGRLWRVARLPSPAAPPRGGGSASPPAQTVSGNGCTPGRRYKLYESLAREFWRRGRPPRDRKEREGEDRQQGRPLLSFPIRKRKKSSPAEAKLDSHYQLKQSTQLLGIVDAQKL